jgi:hypothetical protein
MLKDNPDVWIDSKENIFCPWENHELLPFGDIDEGVRRERTMESIPP